MHNTHPVCKLAPLVVVIYTTASPPTLVTWVHTLSPADSQFRFMSKMEVPWTWGGVTQAGLWTTIRRDKYVKCAPWCPLVILISIDDLSIVILRP